MSYPSDGNGKRSLSDRKPNTHGAWTLKRALDTGRLDMRSEAGQAIKRLRTQLETDLGGADTLSTQERLLVDRIVKKALIIEALETYALSRRSIFKRNGELIGALGRHYLSYTEALRRDLLAVGLGRRAKDVPNLSDYLNARAAANGTEPEPYSDMENSGIASGETTQDVQEAEHTLPLEEEPRAED